MRLGDSHSKPTEQLFPKQVVIQLPKLKNAATYILPIFFFILQNRIKQEISFAPDFQCCYFCGSSCWFYLGLHFDFYVSKILHL